MLPCVPKAPIGGFKVVYAYANQLAERGHSVTVVHPAALEAPHGLWGRLTDWRAPRRTQLSQSFQPAGWFAIDHRVRLLVTPSLHPKHIPHADVVVATAWQTAECVATYPRSKGTRLYFVQDYEFYMTAGPVTRQRMVLTYHSGMHIVTYSPLVTHILQSHGVKDVDYAPIGIDLDVFFREVPIDSASRRGVIGFPGRAEPFKGTRDAISALELVRKAFVGPLHIYAFGPGPGASIPEWVHFHQIPTNEALRALYNGTGIFILPSHYEGFGLPGAEASACGAALACTDSGGVQHYAFDNRTALLSPPADPEALARNVLRLLRDTDLRLELARQGESHVRRFTWHAAGDGFERVLDRALAKAATCP